MSNPIYFDGVFDIVLSLQLVELGTLEATEKGFFQIWSVARRAFTRDSGKDQLVALLTVDKDASLVVWLGYVLSKFKVVNLRL